MGQKDYMLSEKMGVISDSSLEDFFENAAEGETIEVTIENERRVATLVMVERVKEKYGEITTNTNSYGTETTVLFIISCDGLTYVAGLDFDEDDDYYSNYPMVFFPIKDYVIDVEKKMLIGQKIESLRDQDCPPVEPLSPVSRFGGYPVDSMGKQLETWPHFGPDRHEHPLVFHAQYQLPDSRMVWVFVGGVEALQTVMPMEKNPLWNGNTHYTEDMSGAELYDIMDRLYGRDRWHYDNREFVGQKRPIEIRFDSWKWENNGIAVLIEGEDPPSWITMKKAISEMLPFLTVSQEAKSFPAGIRHAPQWIQSEKHDAWDFREFLFQIDDGAGGIDFPYGDLGSLYIYWNGINAGVAAIQCY